MSISQMLLPELEQEAVSTRKTLERLPDDKFGWKPHEKSFALGPLANHIVDLYEWGTTTLDLDEFDFAPPGGPKYSTPKRETREEVLKAFDENLAKMRESLARTSDEKMHKDWALKSGGHVIFSMPTMVALRSFVFNHMVHHRAQLGVYLRLNDIPVPAVYGPSADETGM